LGVRGRLHVQQADLKTLQLRNRVLIKKRKKVNTINENGKDAEKNAEDTEEAPKLVKKLKKE